MALFKSSKCIWPLRRPGVTLASRFGVIAVKPVEGTVLKRAFATTMQRRGGGGDWVYRRQSPRPEKGGFIDIAATGVMTYIYWWIFWHMFTEPGHVFGEWDFPDPTAWTDEELGIPPDDYEG